MAKRGNTQNLKPFKKGEPNPGKGRPLGSRNRAKIVKEILEALIEKGANAGKQGVDAMTEAVLRKGLKGDVKAFNALMDSAYGKVKDTMAVDVNYTKMGTVKVVSTEAPAGKGKKGKVITKTLSFDIGTPVKGKPNQPAPHEDDDNED